MPKKTFKKDWTEINKRIKNRKKKYKDDERLFTLTYNDQNTAKVTMRFLDAPDIDMPYAEVKSHFFNDVGGWFIENCPNTIDEKCPVCDHLYAENYYETDNDLYYDRKKNTNYYTNVLIIDDVNKPENNGKVFIFKFGTKIMEKVDDILEEGKQPWDDGCGVNFVYSAKRKGGNSKQTSYDASRFSDAETELSEFGDEDQILEARYDLGEFTEKSTFKSYEELQTKYNKVIGEEAGGGSKKKRTRKSVEEDDIEDEEIIEEDDFDEDIGDEDMLEDGDDDDFFDDIDEDED